MVRNGEMKENDLISERTVPRMIDVREERDEGEKERMRRGRHHYAHLQPVRDKETSISGFFLRR